MTDKEALAAIEKEIACKGVVGEGCDFCYECPHYVPPDQYRAALAVATKVLREKVEAEKADRLKHPCEGCDTGWGEANSTGTAATCEETCERLKAWKLAKAKEEEI